MECHKGFEQCSFDIVIILDSWELRDMCRNSPKPWRKLWQKERWTCLWWFFHCFPLKQLNCLKAFFFFGVFFSRCFFQSSFFSCIRRRIDVSRVYSPWYIFPWSFHHWTSHEVSDGKTGLHWLQSSKITFRQGMWLSPKCFSKMLYKPGLLSWKNECGRNCLVVSLSLSLFLSLSLSLFASLYLQRFFCMNLFQYSAISFILVARLCSHQPVWTLMQAPWIPVMTESVEFAQ